MSLASGVAHSWYALIRSEGSEGGLSVTSDHVQHLDRLRTPLHRRSGQHRPTPTTGRTGVAEDHIYLHHDLTGPNRKRLGLGRLSPKQQTELRRMYASADYSIADLAELFSVSRPTVYRTLQRSQPSQTQ
jgi:DNA-directed RNA polymerase specialized sigma24 family protein